MELHFRTEEHGQCFAYGEMLDSREQKKKTETLLNSSRMFVKGRSSGLVVTSPAPQCKILDQYVKGDRGRRNGQIRRKEKLEASHGADESAGRWRRQN
jgi:hypothetical protein